jgi:hypothetical protein
MSNYRSEKNRFVIIKVEKYSFEEFKQVAMKVLNSGS